MSTRQLQVVTMACVAACVGWFGVSTADAALEEDFEDSFVNTAPPGWTAFGDLSGNNGFTESTDAKTGSKSCAVMIRQGGGAEFAMYRKFSNLQPSTTGSVSIYVKAPNSVSIWWFEAMWSNADPPPSLPGSKSSWTLGWKHDYDSYGGTGGVWVEQTMNVTTNASGEVYLAFVAGSWGGTLDVLVDSIDFSPAFDGSLPSCTYAECFHDFSWYSTDFNASWGSAVSWFHPGGGTGLILRGERTSAGSSVRAQQYPVTPLHAYEISIREQLPVSSGGYWMESGFRVGSHAASDFDTNAAAWTLLNKWESGTHAWEVHTATFDTGASDSALTVGLKLGASNVPAGTAIAEWDYIDIDDLGSIEPTAVCQDITVTLDPTAAGTVVVTAAEIDGGSTAGYDRTIDSLEISKDGSTFAADVTFSCTDLGDNVVTLRVNQNDGQTAECSATVTVVAGDYDSDGTDDCADFCYDDPNKVVPGACGCGVPETDTDGDTIPDCNDPDDDNDGVADVDDSDPLDNFVCRDVDGDGCDDCSSGVDDPANDGPDTDGDGLCDAGDPYLDNLLELNVESASLYIQPSELANIDMDVFNLQQLVTGCQAVMAFNSTFFSTGPADVNIAAGGGDWTELIYEMWNDDGDLDVVVGVDLSPTIVGTDADGTIADIALTPTGVEGETQLVFRPDGADVESTYFSDTNHQPVYPTKVDSESIIIDGTAPLVPSLSSDVSCTDGSVELTFATTDDTSNTPDVSGVEYYELFVDAVFDGSEVADESPVTSPYTLDLSTYGEGDHDLVIRAYDRAGNYSDSAAVTVSVDQSAPTISNIVATQDGASVLCSDSGIAVQGTVDLYVDVEDTGCSPLQVPPSVVVDGLSVSYVGVTGVTYQYEVTVTPTSANGAHLVTVDATDALGNASSDSSESICVNKDQISGEISQDTLSSATYNSLRDVDFVVTDASGDVLGTWTVTVDFVNDPDPDGDPLTDDGVATGSYVLTNVTGGVDVAGLSADTASTLREKQAVTLDGDGQATVDFTGADQLRPGDLNDSNSVTILDYSILKAAWNGADPVADMNGDGLVKTFDYLLLKKYWFNVGDLP